MTHRLQKELQRELNERIPRGPRGSDQNLFRGIVWFWRQQGRSFDDSVTKAREYVRQHTPDFEPRLLSDQPTPHSTQPHELPLRPIRKRPTSCIGGA